jgi:hypothetical protein
MYVNHFIASFDNSLWQVEQYKRRVSRKKASVEAMLKSAMQSQLDGVRVGLNQLQAALHDIEEIKQKCVASLKTFEHFGALFFSVGLLKVSLNFKNVTAGIVQFSVLKD